MTRSVNIVLSCSWSAMLIIVIVGQNLNFCDAWTSEIQPNRFIEYDASKYARFPEIKTSDGNEYFKFLNIDDDSVLIGAKNVVYNLSLINRLKEKDHIEWKPSEAHTEMCLLKGKNQSDCQNYIRIFARVSSQQIILCGTNAFRPLCRYYKVNPINPSLLAYEMAEEFVGEAICPYSPIQNNSYIYTNTDELLSATSVGFAGSQQLIYRQRLSESYNGITPQPLKTDFRNDILNQASFVNTLEYNGYIMFFFREQALEYQNCGKSIYSRVARVCKNDKGGSHPYQDRFSSFLKTRLNCSMPGEYPFYFDELQATSNIIDGIYGNEKDALVYTILTTNDNAIDGSAVCVYSMNTILEAFEGKFKNQRDINSIWKSLDDSELPAIRPGKCVDDSRTLPSATVNFILKNPLMDGAVNPIHGAPLLVHTGASYKFTSIAVDAQVENLNGKSYDVVFVGTDDGQVLKLINAASASSLSENKPVVISENQVLPKGTRIKELRISKITQQLIIVSDNTVVSIPLHNCSVYNHCSECTKSRDPYCVWYNNGRECIHFDKTVTGKNSGMYIESIDGTNDFVCGDAPINSYQKTQQSKSANSQTHGTVTSYGKVPAQTDNEVKDKDENYHKYSGIAVIQAPSQQSTEYYESQVQTSSASIVLLFVIAALIIGVLIGCGMSKCLPPKDCTRGSSFPFGADSQHRNHLGWQVNPSKQLLNLPTMNNGGKDINLLMNTNTTSTINNSNNINKKDNLELEFSLGSKDRTHECKNSNESLDKDCKSAVISATGGGGTLQKVKKTYI